MNNKNHASIQFNEQSSSKFLSGVKLENGTTSILSALLSAVGRKLWLGSYGPGEPRPACILKRGYQPP